MPLARMGTPSVVGLGVGISRGKLEFSFKTRWELLVGTPWIALSVPGTAVAVQWPYPEGPCLCCAPQWPCRGYAMDCLACAVRRHGHDVALPRGALPVHCTARAFPL